MSSSDSEDEKEYEVERIIEAKVDRKKGRKIFYKYLVKWKGYELKDNTWEPQDMFENAPLAIEEFWKSADTGGRDWVDARAFKVGERFYAARGVPKNASPSRRKSQRKEKENENVVEDVPSQTASASTSSQRRSARNKAAARDEKGESKRRPKGGKTSVSSDEEETATPMTTRSRQGKPASASRVRKAVSSEDEMEVEEVQRPSTRTRGRKAKVEKTSVPSDDEAQQGSTPMRTRRQSKIEKMSISSEEEEDQPSRKVSPRKRRRPRPHAISSDEEDEPEAFPRKRVRTYTSSWKTAQKAATAVKPPSSKRSVRTKDGFREGQGSEDDQPLRPRKKPQPALVKSKGKGKAVEIDSDDSNSSAPRVVPNRKRLFVSVEIPNRKCRSEFKASSEEVDSPGGSLFSGDDIDGDGEPDDTLPDTVPETGPSVRPPSVPPRDTMSSSATSLAEMDKRRSTSLSMDGPSGKSSKPGLPAHRQGPRTKLIKDPNLHLPANTLLPAPPSSSTDFARPASKPILAPSSLMTFAKGSLYIRGPDRKAAPVSRGMPPLTRQAEPSLSMDVGLQKSGALQDEVSDGAESISTKDAHINETMGGNKDLIGNVDADGEYESTASNPEDELLLRVPGDSDMSNVDGRMQSSPSSKTGELKVLGSDPLTAISMEAGEIRELITRERTSMNGLNGLNLPEFDEDNQTAQADVSIEEGEVKEADSRVTLPETPTSATWRPSSLLASSTSSSSWKQSTIFGLATPPTTAGSYSYLPFDPPSLPGDMPEKSNRLVISIPLDPSHSIPIVLKDVLPATYDITSRLTDQLAGVSGGPPGKLYSAEVLQFVKKGGSCARIALAEGHSPDHEAHLNQLRLELETGKLFIVVIGSHTVVLFSSLNRDVGVPLLVPDNLLGLSKTLIMSHITVEPQAIGGYAKYAMESVDLEIS